MAPPRFLWFSSRQVLPLNFLHGHRCAFCVVFFEPNGDLPSDEMGDLLQQLPLCCCSTALMSMSAHVGAKIYWLHGWAHVDGATTSHTKIEFLEESH
jgi:hypothetical protein